VGSADEADLDGEGAEGFLLGWIDLPDVGRCRLKALSEYLGHSDPGFTLRTYTHLLPSSETRTRKAIDDAFTETETAPEAEAEGDGDPPAAQGSSVPPAKPMCPGRLTAPLRH
jgi:hypothetical protein